MAAAVVDTRPADHMAVVAVVDTRPVEHMAALAGADTLQVEHTRLVGYRMGQHMARFYLIAVVAHRHPEGRKDPDKTSYLFFL